MTRTLSQPEEVEVTASKYQRRREEQEPYAQEKAQRMIHQVTTQNGERRSRYVSRNALKQPRASLRGIYGNFDVGEAEFFHACKNQGLECV